MGPAKRILAALAGLAGIGFLRHAIHGYLDQHPIYAYKFEWFLKFGPGEGWFYLIYVLGGVLLTVLLAWAVAPLAPRVVSNVAAVADHRLTWAGVALGAGLIVLCIGLWVLRGQVVTDDEYVYVFQSRILAAGRAAYPAYPLPEFLKNVFVVSQDGRWFGQYPPGHSLMLLPGVLLGLPRLIPAVVAGVNVLLAGAVLRRVTGPTGALAGAALLGTSPLFLLTGATLLSHSTAALGLGVAVWGSLRCAETGHFRDAMMAAAGIGFVFLTRPWTGVTLGVFPLALLGFTAARHRRWDLSAAVAVVLFLFGGAFLGYNWAVSGNPITTGYQAIRGPGMAEFGFGTIFPGVHDHTPLQGLKNAAILGLRFTVWAWGWPFAVLPLLFAFGKERRRTEPAAGRHSTVSSKVLVGGAAGMIVVGLLSYVPYWATGVHDTGPVKTYELLLPMTVLTVVGARRWAGRHGPGVPAAWVMASAVVALAVFWPLQIHHLRDLSASVRAPLAAVEAQVDRPAMVFVGNVQTPTATSWVFGRPNPRPDLSDPILYVRDLGPNNRRFFLLHPERKPYRLIHDGTAFVAQPLFRKEAR